MLQPTPSSEEVKVIAHIFLAAYAAWLYQVTYMGQIPWGISRPTSDSSNFLQAWVSMGTPVNPNCVCNIPPSPIISWQIHEETMETVRDFTSLVSKITADGDCSHEIKRPLLLGRKPVTNLDSILKSRDITLPTKVHLVKAMVFIVVMYGRESWTIKKAEHQRIDAFELWYWRRFLNVPWTARTSNQSILKKISPEYSFEGLMLKLQYFGHLIPRTDSLEKTLMLGKIEGRIRGRQRMKWLYIITNLMDKFDKALGVGVG